MKSNFSNREVVRREVMQPRIMPWRRLLLACVLTGCVTTAITQADRPSPGVPMQIWAVRFVSDCEAQWMAPATYCQRGAVLMYTQCRWRCVRPAWEMQ